MNLAAVVAYRLIVFVIVFAVVFADSADARGRRSRGRTNYVQIYSVAAIAGGPQAVAEAKAALLASRNAGFHPAGGMGGANAEGWGFSAHSAQAALDSCCFSGQRTIAGQAVARGAWGWYAIRLYW